MTRARSPHSFPRSPTAMVLILGPLVMLGSLTTDLYLPAFPAISAELGTSRELVQLSVAASLIGVAAGQLLGGAWSDKVGRRLPLLIGTGVHVGASIAIAFVPDVSGLLMLRIVQGAGAAAASVVAMAIARDLVVGAALVRLLARLALFSGFAPVVAPFLGALLLHTVDWRGLFVVLGVYGAAVALLCLLALPETHRPDAASVTQSARYRAVFGDPVFVGAALLGAMACTGVFIYVAVSSFILQDGYGLSPAMFGVVFAINAAAFALGSQLAARIVVSRSPGYALRIALPLWAIAGASLVVIDVMDAGALWFFAATFLFLAAAGITLPVAQVLGLAAHGAQAGTASSVLGASNFAIAGVISPLAVFIAPSPVTALGISLAAAAALGGAATLVFLRSPRRRFVSDNVL